MSRFTPPPAEATTPNCSVCGMSTYMEDESFCCESCGIVWPLDFHLHDGEWMNEDAEPCGATLAKVGQWLDMTPHYCILDAGHKGSHRAAPSPWLLGHQWSDHVPTMAELFGATS